MNDTTISLTPATDVHYWLNEPTAQLRWRDGVLEQAHLRIGTNAYGHQISREIEWKPVPEAAKD